MFGAVKPARKQEIKMQSGNLKIVFRVFLFREISTQNYILGSFKAFLKLDDYTLEGPRYDSWGT